MLGSVQVIDLRAVADAGGAEHTALLEGILTVVGQGQISAFAAGAGNDNQRGVGIGQSVVVDTGSVILSLGGLGDGPVLTPHTNHGPGGAEVGVEISQCSVVLQAGIRQTLQQGHGGIRTGQGAGTGTAVDGVGCRPAEGIDLGVLQGQDIVLVFQQDNAFLGDLRAQLGGITDAFLADVAAVAQRQIDDGINRAGQNQVHDNNQCQNEGQPCVAANQLLLSLGELDDGNRCHNRQNQNNRQRDQMVLHQADDGFDVIQIDS